MKTLLLIASLLTAGLAVGCNSASTDTHPSNVGIYGVNNTLDPGDITGTGTSGNIRGLPGFAPSTSQPSR